MVHNGVAFREATPFGASGEALSNLVCGTRLPAAPEVGTVPDARAAPGRAMSVFSRGDR